MWCFVWSATVLGDVFQRIRVLCVPDKSSSPDDFQNEVEIGFEELDDPESVDFWMSWVFLNPDLEGSAPPVWWAVVLDSKGYNESMYVDDPFVVFVWITDGSVVAVVSTGR